MNTKYLGHSVAILILVGASSSVLGINLRGRHAPILIDGNLREWRSRDMMYPDEQIYDGEPPNSTYSIIYVCNDDSSLYIGLQLKAPSSINSNWTHNLYIDTDMDSSTGFNSGWMTGGGYDRLVQYGARGAVYSIYKFGGEDRSKWSWEYLGQIGYAYERHMIEWSIPLNQLDDAPKVRLEFHTLGPDVETETWAHSTEVSVGTYSLAPTR